MNDLKGKRILVVEDLEDNRMVISFILEEFGAHVDEAEDGQEALEKILVERYDMILLDIHMPIKTGLELMEDLKDKKIKVPVIAMTASHSMDFQAAKAHGFVNQVAKPVDPDTLFRCIQGQL